MTYKDTNATVTAITGNDKLIVRNQSTLECTFTAATAIKYAAMANYQTIWNGTTTTRTSVGSYNLGTINSSQNLTLQAKAIDSRGNTTTISNEVQILDWVAPIINATAVRINNYENETNLLANVQISDVNGLNNIQQLQYRTKKTTETTWGSWVNFSDNTKTEIILNNLFAWNLQVRCADKFGTSTQDLYVSKGMPIMYFDTEKLSVGVDCFPSGESSLETVNFWASGNSTISGKDVIFQSGTWTPTVISTGTAPTHSFEYRYGRYYRVNSLVYITFHMKFSITSAGSGYARVGGLPYVSIPSGVNGQGLGLRELTINTSGISNACGYILDGASQIQLSNSSGMVAQTWANGTCWVGFSGFYLIDSL